MEDPRSSYPRNDPGALEGPDSAERRVRWGAFQALVVIALIVAGVWVVRHPTPRRDHPARSAWTPRAARAPAERVAPSPSEGAAPRGSNVTWDEADLPKIGEYVHVESFPRAVVRVPPTYPESARRAGVSGTVLVQALVGRDGTVRDTRVVSSIPMLDAAAVRAVQQWRFEPATDRGRPVAVWVAIPVTFTLR
jgi:TonB family protein